MILHHQISGDGPAVVLLHSGVADIRQWDPQWEALTAHHRVLRYDRRGYGETPLPHEEYDDATDLVRLLDELGIATAILVGSSAGGELAQQVASAWPERVTGLVLLCAAADVEPTDAIRAFARREDELLEEGELEGAVALNVQTFLGPEADEETRQLVHEMQHRAFEVQLAAGDDVPQQPGPEIRLERAKMPAVVVSGALDLDYFTHAAEHLTSELPDARHVVLDWAGHLPNLERPAEMTEWLVGVLGELALAGR